MTATNTTTAPAATTAVADPTPAPAAQAVPAPAAPSGAVWDALMANPGGSVAAIAAAAGASRSVVRDALTGYQAAGRAALTPGKGRNGGTWTAVSVAEPDASATDSTDATATPATDAPAPPAAAPVTAPVVTAETIQNAMELMTAEAERRAAAEAELATKIAEENARRTKIEAELAKARTTETTRQALTDLLAAVTATYAAVAAGDEAATTAGLDRIFIHTDHVRRATKAPAARATGTRTGGTGTTRGDRAAPRPLRPEVIAHLTAHPGKDFTPGEIGKVLDRSSGAVANALDTLAKNGEAVLTNEHPARYRLAPATDAPADAPAPAPAPATTAPDAPAAA